MKQLPYEQDPRALEAADVLFVRGGDLEFSAVEHRLRTLAQSGGHLLARDAEAAARLIEYRLPFTTLDGWVGLGGLDHDALEATVDALRAARLSHPNPLFVDAWVEGHIWRNIVVGHHLAMALRSSNVRNIRIPAEDPHAPRIATLLERLERLVLGNVLGDAVEVLDTGARTLGRRDRARRFVSASPVGAALRLARRSGDSVRARAAASALRTDDGHSVLGIVMSRRELQRSREFIRVIAAAHGGSTVVIPWEESTDAQDDAVALSDFPTLRMPIRETPSSLRERRRHRAASRCGIAQLDLGELELHRDAVATAFEVLADQAAARAERRSRLISALRGLHAGTVLTSRIDEESRLLTDELTDHGLQVLTVPHGVVMDGSAKTLATRIEVFEIAGIVDPTCPPGVLHYFPEAVHLREYPHRSRTSSEGYFRLGTVRVLALSEGFKDGRVREHSSLLQALVQAALETAPNVSVAFKPHPGTPEIEATFLRTFGGSSTVRIVPRDIDLHSLLEETDVVVAVNAAGSALVHAVELGLPLVLLWGRQKNRQAGPARQGSTWPAFWAERHPVVGDADALVELLQRIIHEPEFLLAMRQASLDGAVTLRPDANDRSLTRAVRELVRDRSGWPRVQTSPVARR